MDVALATRPVWRGVFIEAQLKRKTPLTRSIHVTTTKDVKVTATASPNVVIRRRTVVTLRL